MTGFDGCTAVICVLCSLCNSTIVSLIFLSQDQTLDREPANCEMISDVKCFVVFTADTNNGRITQQKRIEKLQKQVLDSTRTHLRKREIDNTLVFRIAERTHMFNITLQAVFCASVFLLLVWSICMSWY